MPDLSIEIRLCRAGDRRRRGRARPLGRTGDDRGLLARPVRDSAPAEGLDDSKKLSAKRRAAFHAVLTGPPHRHAVVTVPVAVIDSDGILKATLDGMARAASLAADLGPPDLVKSHRC